jgi:hypothetical protein
MRKALDDVLTRLYDEHLLMVEPQVDRDPHAVPLIPPARVRDPENEVSLFRFQTLKIWILYAFSQSRKYFYKKKMCENSKYA